MLSFHNIGVKRDSQIVLVDIRTTRGMARTANIIVFLICLLTIIPKIFALNGAFQLIDNA